MCSSLYYSTRSTMLQETINTILKTRDWKLHLQTQYNVYIPGTLLVVLWIAFRLVKCY